MVKEIWLLETSNCDYTAYASLEDAYAAARAELLEWGYDPASDHDKEIFEEFENSYNDPKYAGFYVEDLFWCYEIDYFD